MQEENVTILMPAYNADRYIGRAVESVLAQTYPHFELLIIDDGSKDGTFAAASACAAKDSRIRALSQPNAGIAPTMNRGLEMAGSEWVFCMHADDLMMPNRIERQLAFLEQNPDVAVASSLVYYLNERDEVVGQGRSPFTDPAAVARAVKNGEMIAFNHPATVLKKSAVLEVGGYRQEFWPAEDIDLWNRIVEKGHRVAVQDEFLLKYRIHGTSASISRARLMQQKAIWMEQCILRRRQGLAEYNWEQFLTERKKASWPTRFGEWRRELGRTYYQAATHHFSTRTYHKLIPTLLAAAVLEPKLVLDRVMPRLVKH